MATQLFQPRNGDKAVWRDLYEYLRQQPYGDLVPYDKLGDLVGHDVRSDRGPVFRAQKEIERYDRRTLVCERNVGYRIALPEEHYTMLEKHRKRSYRQIVRARRRGSSAPRERLSADEVRKLDDMDVRLSQQEMMLRHLGKRVTVLEQKDVRRESTLTDMQGVIEQLRKKGILD